ncbi:unnamed protein product [Nesidiocoris tenuis]|uniref:Uncharacterized protein n=1 Tax=Nesidiocoris tenuis TaxID=355587 RepID=A0A6H5GNU4_9HEMI|nr:unnamed protein product [Nesidiocoris tenuis]
MHSAATTPLGRPSPVPSPTRMRWDIPPRVPSKKTMRSLSLAPEHNRGVMTIPRIDDKSNSADGIIQDQMSRSVGCETVISKFSTHSLPRGGTTGAHVKRNTLPKKMSRVISDPTMSPSGERKTFPETAIPPPKPSTRPILADLDLTDSPHYTMTNFPRASYHASGSDSGNGSGDSVQSSAAGDISDSAVQCTVLTHRPGGVIIKNPISLSSSFSSTTLKACDYDSGLEDSIPPVIDIELPPTFNLEAFQTILLPVMENKPLDATALKGVRTMLQDHGSRIIANHLTRTDLELIIDHNKFSLEETVGFSCGLELCALPFGKQMRLDLIESWTDCKNLCFCVTGGRISSPVEAASIGQWESSSPDLGLKTLTMHMEESRRVVRSLPSFRRNSEIVLSDARVVDLLSDVFRTEFQLKFLWGSRGANVKSSERYAKFEQILTAMSDMCEPRPKSPPSPAPMSPGSYNPAIGTSVRWPCQWTPDLLNIDSTRWIPSTYSSRWVAVYHSTPSCCQTGATSCPRQFQLPPRGRLGTPKATSVIKEWSS